MEQGTDRIRTAQFCFRRAGASSLLFAAAILGSVWAAAGVTVGGEGANCLEDPACINRLHPDIPMAARARAGDMIRLRTRDALDTLGVIEAQTEARPTLQRDSSRVHAVTGPVFIEGAKAGDTLKVTLQRIQPGRWGYTIASAGGFASDLMGDAHTVIWELDENFARSDDLPGVRIPNAGFPGVVTTLPGPEELDAILRREGDLAAAGGDVGMPEAKNASPVSLCGPGARAADACLRTFPPREHGGNMDIRYLKRGVSIYLPCYIDGCGLAIGDLHYAQGDGEVSGWAIEMSADVWLTADVVENGPDLSHGPHYEGDAALLDIPSRRFYAATGFPLKKSGEVPRDMTYLESGKVAGLENLSNDIDLAARNALDAIVDYIVSQYGYEREQAYIIASVAVDLRIAQLVDAPNFGVTAILPLDIFEER